MNLNPFEIELLEGLKGKDNITASDVNYPQELFDITAISLRRKGLVSVVPTEEVKVACIQLTSFGRMWIAKP